MTAPTQLNPSLGPLLPGYDPTSHSTNVAVAVSTPVQDATTGVWYAPLLATVGNVVGIALTPYASNPTQTASAGADTLYKFGAAGTTSFNHVSGQNNTGATVFLAFDQSTTVAGNQVYAIANGQMFAFDRQGTVLHFSSAAQQNFGGTTGITVEAFA